MRRVEPKGRRKGGKGAVVSRRGQPGWKEPSSAQIPGGDGAVGANLITPWGQTLPQRVGAQPKRPISLPKYQQYSLVYLGARVQMDLFWMILRNGLVRLPPGSMQVRTMDSTLGAAALLWLPRMRQATSQGVTLQGHKILHRNFLQPPNQQAHLANK